MNRLIIIRGPPAVGKSTTAKALAERIKAKVVHFDRVMTGLELGIADGEKQIPLDRFIEADRIMLPKITKYLDHSNLILEGNFFYKEHVEDLKGISENAVVITLRASIEECLRRDKGRIGELGEKVLRELHKDFRYFGKIIDCEKNQDVSLLISGMLRQR